MLALYRKYRPKTLGKVVGQPQITEPLISALKSGKVSHSYLFTGPRGTGKTSVARILAHEINGFPYELEDNYLDIIEIDAASNTGVDNIRDLREKAIVAPSEGKFKVYIIDEVHMLSKSAFNALLKTLEEPPAHVVFILATTDLEKVPVTILSRSQVFRFRLADEDTMLTHLQTIVKKEKIKISEPALRLIVRRGGGSFRDTLSLLDQISALGDGKTEISEEKVSSALGVPKDSLVASLLSAYQSGDSAEITRELKTLLSEGLKPESVAEALIKNIIASPSAETLPLLEKLPTVSAPFPEAKLTVALLADKLPASKLPASKTQTVTPVPKTAPKTTPKTPTAQPPETPAPSENSPAPKPSSKAPTDFSWDSFLASIQTANQAIFQQLKKCEHKATNGRLDLFPERKITKTILSRPANTEILLENLGGDIELIIHDPEDLEKSPEISKISDIMGRVEEVKENGGIPF